MQACGTSLVETVNHVLDFTKLSGNAKAGGVENVIHLSRLVAAHSHVKLSFLRRTDARTLSARRVNLMQLVEDATEGCWIGHRARMFTSEIGSVYSPPKQDRQQSIMLPNPSKHVETVIDIGHSEAVCAASVIMQSSGPFSCAHAAPQGWTFRCEKGGIRRILMNVFGNSLKFTSVCRAGTGRDAEADCFVECRTDMFT